MLSFVEAVFVRHGVPRDARLAARQLLRVYAPLRFPREGHAEQACERLDKVFTKMACEELAKGATAARGGAVGEGTEGGAGGGEAAAELDAGLDAWCEATGLMLAGVTGDMEEIMRCALEVVGEGGGEAKAEEEAEEEGAAAAAGPD